MRNDVIEHLAVHTVVQTPVPPTVHEHLDVGEREALRAEIKTLLAANNAVLVAHYYTNADLQALADETGGYVSDSLDMARFGHEHAASTQIGRASCRERV